MAKHSRRGFRAFGMSLPKFSDIKKSAKGTDILMGAGVGIVGILGAQWLVNKLTATVDSSGAAKTPTISAASIPAFITKIQPFLGGTILGALAYALYRKKSASRAAGWLIGSVGAGLAVTGLDYARSMSWAKNMLPAPASAAAASTAGYGVLTQDRRLPSMGVLQSDRSGMNQLAAMAMGDLSGADELEQLLA